ncbi:MAG: hypothetical protein ACMUJM_20380 [bacterium]
MSYKNRLCALDKEKDIEGMLHSEHAYIYEEYKEIQRNKYEIRKQKIFLKKEPFNHPQNEGNDFSALCRTGAPC